MKGRHLLLAMIAAAFVLPPAALILAQQAGAGRATLARPAGPCDVYAAANTPCVAAHSTTRALKASYGGPLYQVRRASDGKMLDVGVVAPTATDAGGYADAAAQDAFCADTLCVINRIYDQSGQGNDLFQAGPGTFFGPAKGGFDTQPIADMAPLTIMGHKSYGVYIIPGMGFRNNNATGLAIDDEPEGVYSVMDGTHYDSGCCFDYGNASTNGRAVGTGTMETTYLGTSSTWGRGDGSGPWIMADMEGGVFSGYSAKQNTADPTIDSWRFVTAVVDGGGGNVWDLRGGNAQQGRLTTFYSGVRPGSNGDNRYFPMHKQGGILLGTGGDNGNGSSGTFYEGVMTRGRPTEAATDAVQANIVAARYNVASVSLSRIPAFTPKATQEVTTTFTNTTDAPVSGVALSIAAPADWTSVVLGTAEASKTFEDRIPPGATVSATFTLESPAVTGAGYLIGKAAWSDSAGRGQLQTATARCRNVFPVKINEVQFGSGNSSSQFIELYNAGAGEVDISNWSLISTQSQWASVKLATILAGTKLPAKGFYLLGLSGSGLSVPAGPGDVTLYVRSTTGLNAGQGISIDGEQRKIARVGTAATSMTTLFIPVSTGPWITFPAGSTNLPVTNAAGFAVGDKISIDLGGHDEFATVTAVGKAATQTTLAAGAAGGEARITIAAAADITIGDTLTLGTGARKELVTVERVLIQPGANAGAGGGFAGGGRGGRGATSAGTVELAAPLKFDHASGIDVSDAGTGITFTPATQYPHASGDAVQALGSGITLDRPLDKAHAYGAPVRNPEAAAEGYQGPPAPNQWFGEPLSAKAGSIALMDAGGSNVVDAMVYGSQQSNSSGNGTVASPELATLIGDQGKGGCIVVVPAAGRGGRGAGRGTPAGDGGAVQSIGRKTDGADTGSNCADFQLQPATPGAPTASDPVKP